MTRRFVPTCLTLALAAALAVPLVAEGVRLRPQPGIYYDDAGGGLNHPEDVACGGAGLVAVADTGNGRLLSYRIEGETITAQPEIRLSQLPYPIAVAVTSKGEFLALDGRLRRVARVSGSGEFAGYIEPVGDTARGPTVPRAIALDGNDALHVLDIFHSRVIVLDAGGAIVRQVSLPAGRHSYSGLTVAGDGGILVVESVERRIYAAKKDDTTFSPLTGPMKDDMAFPTALATDDRGHLFVADEYGSGIVILGNDGSFRGRQSGVGWTEGLLRYPSGLCVAGEGLLLVADRENSRISVFSVVE